MTTIIKEKDISVVMITVDTPIRREYLGASLANLNRTKFLNSPRLFEFHLIDSKKDERTPTQNAAEALRVGSLDPVKWVLFLEDDIDVCEDFLDSVGQWLDRHEAGDRHVYSFFVPHGAIRGSRTEIWDYPIPYFCSTVAFAIRVEDAKSLSDWWIANPVFTGPDGGKSTGAYDLHMRDWAKALWPDIGMFSASVPSFVQHVGNVSEITPDRPPIEAAMWGGPDWSYVRLNSSRVEIPVGRRRRLLIVGDAGCPSGFARSTHHIADHLDYRSNKENPDPWEVEIIGLNYRGDPHPYEYKMWPATMLDREDPFGSLMIPYVMQRSRPDAVIVQNDPWNFRRYHDALKGVPTIGIVAVDGKNVQGAPLNWLSAAIFWTQFGADQAQLGGFSGSYAVIPLGVDLNIYKPQDQQEARSKFFSARDYNHGLKEAFILSNVNRNQPRKRFDLSISYFADWIRSKKINDAYLHLHVAPTGDLGVDCHQLAKYYGVANRLILSDSEVWKGVSEEELARSYAISDVGFSTTQGEGWGLTTMEMMACGIPNIVPNAAALGEWPEDTVVKVDCDEIAVTMNRVNIVGAVPSRLSMIESFDRLYNDREMRLEFGKKGRQLVERDMFRWSTIGDQFGQMLNETLTELGVRSK